MSIKAAIVSEAQGVDATVETQEFIQKALIEFDSELNRLLTTNKRGSANLSAAILETPEIAKDDAAFRLMFLRAEGFDAKKAVKRFSNYWDERVQLFGLEHSFLPLTQDAAMCGDLEALRFGYIQSIRGQQRVIFFNPDGLPAKYDANSVVKSIMYVMESKLRESEAMQQHGAIYLIDLGATNALRFDQALMSRMAHCINNCIPVHASLTCIIRPPFWASFAAKMIKLLMKPEKRDRIRVVDENEELMEIAGVTVEEVMKNDHLKWLEAIKDRELGKLKLNVTT